MATTVAQDSFTEAGSGTAALTTHTPNAGTSWTQDFAYDAGGLLIDKTNDRAAATVPAEFSGQFGGGGAVTAPDVTGEVDVYVSSDDSYYAGPLVRRVSSTTHYRVESHYNVIYLYRRTSGVDTVIGSTSKSIGASRFRLNASGSSPTYLKVKAWLQSGSEGGTWGIETTDSTAANQNATGKVGFCAISYDDGEGLIGAATVDDFLATVPSAAIDAPAVTMAMEGLV